MAEHGSWPRGCCLCAALPSQSRRSRSSFHLSTGSAVCLTLYSGCQSSCPCGERSSVSSADKRSESHLPNKRLKLTGGDRLKGSGVLCPGGHGTFVHYSCAGGRVARRLSAIR